MDRETYNKLIEDFFSSCRNVAQSKSKDYATEDVLSNFKRLTLIAQTYKVDFSKSYHYALFMTLMKFDRLQNLLSNGKTPENESIDDTWKDAFNYLMLAYACYKEKE